jgi:hypothetical protein
MSFRALVLDQTDDGIRPTVQTADEDSLPAGDVTASTGRPETEQYLRDVGAAHVIGRDEIGAAPEKPLLSERWAGCVVAVGGATLAHVIAEMRYGGSVAARGNTAVNFGAATSVIGLEELPDAGAKILAGQVRGRVIVDTSR